MAVAVKRGRSRDPRRGEWKVAVCFLLPAMLGFFIFFVRPTIIGFYTSFTDKRLLSKTSSWIGLENYRDLIDDDKFWNALRVTLQYVLINIGLQTVLAIAIAALLDRFSKSSFLRTLVLSPWLMSNVVVALLFLWILDFRLGIANSLLDKIGIDPVAWFPSQTWAIPSIALINVWRHMGYTALLLFAGFQTIPKEVKEAALVDGCNPVQRFVHVTLPLLRPVIAVVMVITVIGSFQIFDTIAVTTEGGPVNATRVLYVYIFEHAFERNNFAYASALSVALFILLAIVTAFQMKLLRANESDLA